jgi:hypothetical protein
VFWVRFGPFFCLLNLWGGVYLSAYFLEKMMSGAYRDPEACGLECGTGREAA